MYGDSASNIVVGVVLVALTAAKPIIAGTSKLYYPDESNLVATAVSYRYSLPKYSCPVFTFDSTAADRQKANGVLFNVNKPERFGGKFFFLNGATNNLNDDGVEQYFTIGKQYYFKFSEIEDELNMSIRPKDLADLTVSQLWSGRHWGFPYFSDILEANEYKEKLDQKKRIMERELREAQRKLDDMGAANEKVNMNLPKYRKQREWYSKTRDIQGQISILDIYLMSVSYQIEQMTKSRQ